MKAFALFIALAAAGGNALAITPTMAVLLVLGGLLLTGFACAGIVGLVRLAGARPAHLIVRTGSGSGSHNSGQGEATTS
ncbi:hypothetical protein [Nonomuraea sp. NPDC049646]|uniref:hypothetical protein n=1 Tax=unclassified Nonomuraea TaxID=2593643 RepID=UPI0037BC74C7